MVEKQRQKMIAALNEMRGRNDCSEAVILTRRPLWTWLAFVAVFVVVIVALGSTDLPPVVAGGIGGGLAGGLIAVLSENHIVGYCDGSVVMARSGTFSVSAQEPVAEYQRPLPATLSSGMLLGKVTLDGVNYQIAKPLIERFESIAGVRAS